MNKVFEENPLGLSDKLAVDKEEKASVMAALGEGHEAEKHSISENLDLLLSRLVPDNSVFTNNETHKRVRQIAKEEIPRRWSRTGSY